MADFFKQLASEDQNHARRIREYMNELGIEALKIE
jgi:ferritin